MTAEASISVARGGPEYAMVSVHGDLDVDLLGQLRELLGTVVDDGARYLTVDLSRVTSCTDKIADVLTWAGNRAACQRGWLSLTGVRHLFHLAVG